MTKNLICVFSLGMSVERWLQSGIYDKEKVIFEEYLENRIFDRIYWLTYGLNDQEIIERLKKEGRLNDNIFLLPAPKLVSHWFIKFLYSLIYSLWHIADFKKAAAVTNVQTSGAWGIALGKLFFDYKFIYRYGHSLWRRHLHKKQYHRLLFSWPLDKFLTMVADRVFCPTQKDFNAVAKRFQNKTIISPNYIDIQQFIRNTPWSDRNHKAIFVGRLVKVKNLGNLIVACAKKNIALDIYGDGPAKKHLQHIANYAGAKVRFCGVVSNTEIINRLQEYQYFFLVSHYEAMPKALLEAMAAGLVCIVTPNYGCQEIVHDETNGIIANGFGFTNIETAIDRISRLDLPVISKNAIRHIEENYSLKSLVSQHARIYSHLIN